MLCGIALYVPKPQCISVPYYHTEFDTIITIRITYSELIAVCPLEMIYDISLELSSSMQHNQTMHAMLICSDREEWPWMLSVCYSRQFVPTSWHGRVYFSITATRSWDKTTLTYY